MIASEATEAAIPGVHEYKKAGFVGMGMFTEETYPQQATVDETFTGTHTLELGDGKTVELCELSEPGVSSTQTVALIPELNALIVGDLVHHKLHAWLEGGIVDGQATPTIDGWIADLEELETTLRGRSGTDRLRRTGRAGAPLGGRGRPDRLSGDGRSDRHRLRGRARRSGDELSGEKAGEHYAAIQAELEEAFPDYAFPDMISFSVYGLVNAKL